MKKKTSPVRHRFFETLPSAFPRTFLGATILLLNLALGPVPLHARPRSPLPPLPENGVLRQWRFDEGAFLSPLRGSPLEAANADFTESWSGYALRMGGLPPALVRFAIVESDGATNLNCQAGSVRFWFKPDWSSQSLGGKGPGGWARLIEAGAFTDEARFGWWSLHLSPEGDTLHFRAQAGGKTAEYLRANVAWEQGQWHEVALTYDAQGSMLYLDGQLAAKGAGVTLVPGAKAQESLGFALGSDMAGENLAQGEFEELTTYRHPLRTNEVAWIYASKARRAALGPVSVEEDQMQLLTIQALRSGQVMSLDSPPPPPGGGGGGGTNTPWAGTNSFSSTNLHLGPPFWTNGNLMMSYGGGDTNLPPYDLFIVTNFPSLTNYANDLVWSWVYRTAQGQTNWTLPSVPYPQAFFLLAGIADSDGDGLTDAFEHLVSKTLTNSVDTDSDGMPDGWEVANGLNPKANDASGDLDGDGIANGDEYRAFENFIRPTEPLGPSSRRTPLVISEIMYAPAAGQQAFIEIYNAGYLTNDLQGFSISGGADYTWTNSTPLAPRAFTVVYASQWTHGLGRYYGRVRLRNRQDAILLEVNYRHDWPWPEAAGGTGHSLVLARPSYGEDDPRAWAASDRIGGSPGMAETNRWTSLRGVRLNEFLANPTNGQTAFVELYNHSPYPVDVSGALISTNAATLGLFTIPSPTTIPAGGRVYFLTGTNGLPLTRGTSGGTLFLTHPDGQRVLDALAFPAQAPGVAFGRSPDGAAGFCEMTTPTPGSANTPRLRRDIVISEIMYNPISGNVNYEFIEFRNRSTNTIDVTGWLLHGVTDNNSAPSIGSYSPILPGGSVVLLRSKSTMRAAHPHLNGGNSGGNYAENLSNRGQRLMLFNQYSNLISEVCYHDGGRWGRWADGGGSSLELIDARADERFALNWGDSVETNKSVWLTNSVTGTVVGLGDPSTANVIELGLLDSGECLLDNVSLIPSGGAERVQNGNFAGALNSWGFEGAYDRSSLGVGLGPDASDCLYVRGVSRVEYLDNRVTNRLSATIATNIVVTNSFVARWLRGNPELLVRLRGNGFESVATLPVPLNLGSPGLTNSIAKTNVGPAINDVQHFPPVPAASQPVLVTARFDDPDGVATAVLKYRVDPLTTFTNVTLRDDGGAGDQVAGDGIFSGVIPGFASGKMIAFHVEAVDNAATPLTNRFPNDAPFRECLVRFGDSTPSGSFGIYRLWITQSNVNAWAGQSRIDSTPKDLTLVYGTNRVIYNCGGAYSGSDVNSPYFDSPTGFLCGYAVGVPSDDRFLGSSSVDLDLSGQDTAGQREVLTWWLAEQVGLPYNHRRYVSLLVNGVAATSRQWTTNYGTSAVKVYMDIQSPGGDFLSEWYEDRDAGDLYKIAIWRKTYGSTKDLVGNAPSTNANLLLKTNSAGQKIVPAYRWNWRKRAAGNANNNDWTNFFRLVDVVNTNDASYITAVSSTADIEQWGHALGLEHAIRNIDSYGYQIGQNMFAYRPSSPDPAKARWGMLLYDVELGFGSISAGTTESVFDQFSDSTITRLWSTNFYGFRRAYWRSFWSLVNDQSGPMRPSQILTVAAANNQWLTNNSLTISGYSSLTTWINSRYNSLTNQIAAVRPPFRGLTTTGSTSGTTFDLAGQAPIEVAFICTNRQTFTNSQPLSVNWISATQWISTVGVSPGTNTFILEGYDRNMRKLAAYGTEDYTETNTVIRN